MTKNCFRGFSLIIMTVALAGCTANTSSPPQPAATAPQPDPILAGVVAGPIGQQLSPGDREIAGKAQLAAIVDGQRRSWKGKGGTFGFIAPSPVSSGLQGNCRDYSHTIYINGRPQTGRGSACQSAPGQWRIVS